jgi:uncharacterized cupredoxin-like copper-binding protein
MAKLRRLGLVAVPVVFLVACGGSSGTSSAPSGSSHSATSPGSSSPAGASVGAQEKEFSIALDQTTLHAGDVTFNIQNAGTIEHEFVVLKTDKTADQLPQASGEVDEDQLTAVDEVEHIAAGANATLSVNLPAGHYVVICNIPGHYAAGMHADVTVQ